MKKTLSMTLLLLVAVAALARATETTDTDDSSGTYILDADKVDSYQLDELINNVEKNTASATDKPQETPDTSKIMPKIITETTPTGKIEKLVDVDGRVIAEKTIENDKIVKKVLNYYYPDGTLMRQIVAKGKETSFYAEEYYNNGKLASQATYINESNKIGKEKRYDSKGVLRQTIPWIISDNDRQKPVSEQETIRKGEVVTYYPSGNIAAKFAVGENGKSTFFNRMGKPIKTVEGAPILKFTPELTAADCQGTSLQLDLDELIELYEDEGDISYNKCGMPYRESFTYEVQDTQEHSTILFSFDETGMLRRITPYVDGKKEGTMQKFDASGNLSAEINYKNGLKEGYATGYFPNGNQAFLKKYSQGKVEGMMNCYFPDGKIAAQFYYKGGLKDGKAVINSPIQKTLTFAQGKLLNTYQKKSKRSLNSALKDLTSTETQCLNVEKRIAELNLEIEDGISAINDVFQIEVPQECKDMGKFIVNQGKYYCYNADKKRIAVYPFAYVRGDYVVEKVYTPEDKKLYDIPFKNKLRQGWVKQYDDQGKIVAEIYFDKDKIAGTSRSYYPHGRVKDLQTISEDASAKAIAHYDEDGVLQFSLTYKQDNKQEAYLLSKDKRKDIVVRYYENKPDSVRESNAADPYNFIEYNFALDEYVIYQNNQPVKGGYLCKRSTEEKQPESRDSVTIINEAQKAAAIEIPPVVAAENAPVIDDTEFTGDKGLKGEDVTSEQEAPKSSEQVITTDPMANVILKTPEKEQQEKLAAQNIGPIAKPDIENLSDVVQKETLNQNIDYTSAPEESRIERVFYPNGGLRKTIKTKGSRTEEIKEYSKTGLLLTDYMYNADNIVIEKYFGSGQVRRKTEKSYNDNAVKAFTSRQDFYDTGKPRYTIKRQPDNLLFSEQIYYADGALKSIAEQTYPLSFITKEYDKQANLQKEIIQDGINTLIKEYDTNHKPIKITMNDKEIPVGMADNTQALFADNARVYDDKGKLVARFSSTKDYNEILSYYGNGKVKTEILLYQSGEISVKKYSSSGELEKFAHLAPDGKLYIEKPEMRVIPSYRERHWVDYNNPNWIENQEKYSIKSIAKLNVNVISKILGELDIEIPSIIVKLGQNN